MFTLFLPSEWSTLREYHEMARKRTPPAWQENLGIARMIVLNMVLIKHLVAVILAKPWDESVGIVPKNAYDSMNAKKKRNLTLFSATFYRLVKLTIDENLKRENMQPSIQDMVITSNVPGLEMSNSVWALMGSNIPSMSANLNAWATRAFKLQGSVDN